MSDDDGGGVYTGGDWKGREITVAFLKTLHRPKKLISEQAPSPHGLCQEVMDHIKQSYHY